MYDSYLQAFTEGISSLLPASSAVLVALISVSLLIAGSLLFFRLVKLPQIEQRNRIERLERRMAEREIARNNYRNSAAYKDHLRERAFMREYNKRRTRYNRFKRSQRNGR